MADRTLRLRLGLFLGASLIALAGLVVLFGGTPQLFSSNVKYTILYPEAPGIAPGIPIRKSGVRIGQVTGLELDPVSTQVRVHIAVDKRYLPRKSEEANITRGLLSGDTAIDFLPQLGPNGQPVPRGDEWPPGSEIPGVPPLTPRSVINAQTIANAQQSLEKITQTFERFEKTAPRLENAADEAAEMFKEIRAFVPELRKTNQRLQGLLGGADPPRRPGPVVPVGFLTTQPPEGGDGNLRALVRDTQETLRSLRPAIEDFRATIRRIEPELTATAKNARMAFESVNDVLSPDNRKQFAEVLKNINSVSGNISKFVLALGTVLDQAEKMLKNIDTQVTGVGLIVGDVRAVTKPLALRSENLVKSVTDSAEELSQMLAEIRVVVKAFGRENGTIQKLLTEPDVYRNLDAASASVARVMARAEKITKDLEVFADKVARRPELIGVGGALRPSAGLKELPGTPSYHPNWPPSSSARPSAGPNWLPPPQQEQPQWGSPPPVQGYKP